MKIFFIKSAILTLVLGIPVLSFGQNTWQEREKTSGHTDNQRPGSTRNASDANGTNLGE